MQWTPEIDAARLRVLADLARQATERRPGEEMGWERYATALANAGDTAERIAVLAEAVTRLRHSALLQTSYARALLAAERFDESVGAARAAVAIAPEDAKARQALFEALVAARKGDEAQGLVALIADDEPPAGSFLDSYARAVGPEETIAQCDTYLAQRPGHTDAHFHKALALAQLGRDEEARAVMMREDAVSISDLQLPAGFDSIETFNAALAAEIRADPSLKPDPRAKATRGGQQTDITNRTRRPTMSALLRAIQQAVDAYEAARATSSDPIFVHRPRRAKLVSWAVIYGRDGRQVAHRHPDGWISGVYYVAAPRENGRNAYQGPLILGALDPVQHKVATPPWGVQEIEPVPGRLLLFPSFLPHATEPTGIDGARISVAFDVVPDNG